MTRRVLIDFCAGRTHNMDMNMGNLKPGATLIYERANGVIYARESGTTERSVVGYDTSGSPDRIHLSEWNDILRASETNPALREALDRAIIIYKLSQTNE
jgi:hypothetical protein